MSREPKTRTNVAPKTPRFNDVKFVNWSLSAEEKASCKAWLAVEGDIDNAVLVLIEEGYKVTCSYDGYRSCFTASIVPSDDKSPNKGYILTGKGSTPLKAIKQALYIHYHIMDGEWSSYSVMGASEELDD